MPNSFQLIDQNEFAYSAHCKQSARLQMSFGNVSLMMSPHEFSTLKQHVQSTINNVKNIRCAYCRNISIKTSVTNMTFQFSYEELCLMYDIMVNTQNMLEVHSILDHKNS